MLTEVAEGVMVHRSELLRNNTVVVDGPSGVLLVDPGLTEGEMTCLARDLARSGRTVAAGFATHPDWDHVLWHDAFGTVPRYATARCAEVMQELRARDDWRERVASALPPEITGEVPLELFGLVTGLPAGVAEVPWDGSRVRIVEHPAHAPGHAALVVQESGVLVAGDMLSDVFVPMLDGFTGANDPVGDYLLGLERLEAVAGQAEVVVPGHGSVGGAGQVAARIERDRAYLHALRDGREPDDPRIDTPEPGWEWVGEIHAGQARQVAARRTGGPPSG